MKRNRQGPKCGQPLAPFSFEAIFGKEIALRGKKNITSKTKSNLARLFFMLVLKGIIWRVFLNNLRKQKFFFEANNSGSKAILGRGLSAAHGGFSEKD